MLNKIIISGGGSGGHVFPAIAIGQAIKAKYPDCDLLYVGAEGKMEMEKVPQAGFEIVGLPIRGIQRGSIVKNIALPFRILQSRTKAQKTIKTFRPQVAVGVGGYASGPVLKVAQNMKLPTLIQEQNSYAGLTNRLLAKNVKTVCVAYPHMEKYFPEDKLAITGNPIRLDLRLEPNQIMDARDYFGIGEDITKVVFIVGGSLGAKTFNDFMVAHEQDIALDEKTFYIWQYGKYYEEEMHDKPTVKLPNVWAGAFIDQMNYALGISDIVITRAGAIALSELAFLQKAIITVPSPNVVDDHQTKNAQAFLDEKACVMIKDDEVNTALWEATQELLHNEEARKSIEENITKLSFPRAVEDIVIEIEKLI